MCVGRSLRVSERMKEWVSEGRTFPQMLRNMIYTPIPLHTIQKTLVIDFHPFVSRLSFTILSIIICGIIQSFVEYISSYIWRERR